MSKVFIGNFFEREDGLKTVGLVHFNPFDEKVGMGLTEDELLLHGRIIEKEDFPENVSRDGMIATLVYNPITGMLHYEFESVLDSDQADPFQKTNALVKQMSALQSALDEIILGGR